MDGDLVVSLLQQIVDGLNNVQAAVEENTETSERDNAWLGEKLDEIRLAIGECRERVDMEGSHVQDRLNEIKGVLGDLPLDISGAIG